MSQRPLILVSNDDGYQARGIAALIEVASAYGDVLAVAPERGESGMSHAITMRRPLRLAQVYERPGAALYRCDGTPVDCVKIALHRLAPRLPDLMVSGINHGSNASLSVIYSGTMGAALEASLNGIPSAGFSLTDHDPGADLQAARHYADLVLRHMAGGGLPAGGCLNVNVPNLPAGQIRGLKVCRQTRGVWKEIFERRTDPSGADYYWLTGGFENHEPQAPDTDEWALAQGYATVVPVKADLTDRPLLARLAPLDNQQ